jgi:hypothetical protein
MKMDTLDALEDADLRAVIARAEELLAQHDRERKAAALEQARAILSGAGLNLRDIAAKPKNGNKGPVYHGGRQYQHPTNKALIWKAKGQKPGWLRELEASGGKAVELP